MTSRYPGPTVSDRAPDTMICAVDIVRSMIQPGTPPEGEELPPLWTIYGEQSNDPTVGPMLRLFGDLILFDNDWFLGVTAVVGIALRDGDRPEGDGPWSAETLNELTERLAGWASHVLWDVASACGRRLATQSYTGGPDVPVETPEVQIMLEEIEPA